MKAIFTAAVVLGLVGLAAADDKKADKADPVGTWKCEYTIGDMKRTATLDVKKDGDKLAGTMTWQDKKESKLTDMKLKDGELTFSAEREFMDQKFTIKYKLKADGDTIKGKGEADFNGETRSFDIEVLC